MVKVVDDEEDEEGNLKERDMIPCRVQSMQLPEELGCIHHIFCDKTGTLTKNELEFRGISFKGHLSQGMDTKKILQGVY